jgi:hypothetical protein
MFSGHPQRFSRQSPNSRGGRAGAAVGSGSAHQPQSIAIHPQLRGLPRCRLRSVVGLAGLTRELLPRAPPR